MPSFSVEDIVSVQEYQRASPELDFEVQSTSVGPVIVDDTISVTLQNGQTYFLRKRIDNPDYQTVLSWISMNGNSVEQIPVPGGPFDE